MEPFNVAVTIPVMVRRASMGDSQPPQRFQKPGRSERRAVIRGQD